MDEQCTGINETEIKQLQKGNILISLTYLPDDVVGVSSKIYIDAQPSKVWNTLTNYDNLSKYLPKVLSSELVEREGNEIILDQTGKTGIFIFEKHVHFRLKIEEEYPNKISFKQLDGDFQVYRGEWLLETSNTIQGTILSYKAELKPNFFAPPILVNFVQRQDLPGILKAHKQRAESF
jgi:carbon monoxide dehydrogenase subunit G